ncbi:MAG: hypothetical protein PVH41_04845 [Anaerolineae bacterium]|jgi:hypothetical protein
MGSARSELQRRARSAILQYAFFRWESAVVVAGTILVTALLPRPFPWWPVWGWPFLGLLGVAAIFYSSLNDPEANARVVRNLVQQRFNPREIGDRALREEVETALAYQQQIETQIRQQRAGVMHDRLQDTANQLSEWIANVHRLAVTLDAFRRDELLARDMKTVPEELETLTARRDLERDPEIRQELARVVASKGKQWQTLRTLHTRMEQAELRLEQSMTALATIYGQIQLIGAREMDTGRADRLQADIREEIAQLDDLLRSINEISEQMEWYGGEG